MKDGLGSEAVERIADSLVLTERGFPKTAFMADAMHGLDKMELKERVQHLIGVLNTYLPDDFNEAAEILIRLKANWIPGDPDDNLSGFAAWPVIDYVGEYGLGDPEKGLAVLKELTSLFSAEFAIRAFYIQHTELTLKTADSWIDDSNEHVRRLVSEGCRPRLPWGQQLPLFIKDPKPVVALLEQLKDDPSEYVRRSVANNLNDISKDHPETVISLCKRWQKNASAERKWIIRHATRTLVKSGHPAIFGLLGYTDNPQVSVSAIAITPDSISLGDAVEFKATLKSTAKTKQKMVIDYAVHHMKANGQTSPKVFKFCTVELTPGESIVLNKRHAIKAITTRKYYSGEHLIEILINGKTYGQSAFTLNVR